MLSTLESSITYKTVKVLQQQLQASYSRIAALTAEVDLYKKKYREAIDNNEYKEKYRNLVDHQNSILDRDFKMRQKSLTELNYDGDDELEGH
tara:strand:- start:1412 stop:1687 length:276 start_codon:yes stop_codon:yes gene_type:complete